MSRTVQQIGIFIGALVLGVGITLFLRMYLVDAFLVRRLDTTATLELQNKLINLLPVGAFLIGICVVLIVYLAISAKMRAQGIAEGMTKNLLISQDQFETLYELGPVPYLLISPKGTIENPNKASLRLFKMTENELAGKNLFDFFVSEDQFQNTQLFERFRRGGAIADYETPMILTDGTSRYVLASVFQLQKPGQYKNYGLVTLLDITERKQIEKAKTEFVSLAAHQLRTPLSTLNWNTELLLGKDAESMSDKQQKHVQKIREGTMTMIDLVGTLLNVSRIEMGTLPVAYEETDIAQLCDSVYDELSPDIESKKLVVERAYEHPTPFVTDPKLLRIVIQNLFSNAVRYTPDAGKIVIRCLTRGRDLLIEVADTGYGIPKEQQDKIFSKLFRADNAKAKVANGNGLGLYMSKAIVETIGGTIDFDSEIDKGTTFRVVLERHTK